ncbi:MAG: FHA domain-containing protein [Chloroflexi bacterium]|nr:MAG: FHA domain-containing protein [Chloroflexota bacterium]
MEQEAALLVLKHSSGESHQWELDKPVTTIGRWQANDIVLTSREVSRQHARVLREAGRYLVEDCGSKNGTYLNGRRLVGAEPLHDGDVIHIPPNFDFNFVDTGATAPFRTAGEVQPLRLDTEQRRVWIRGEELIPPLSPAQFALLELLAEQPGRAYSRDEIIEVVWPDVASEGVSDAAIDALVRRLRTRLAELDERHQYVAVVRGYGFKLNLPG